MRCSADLDSHSTSTFDVTVLARVPAMLSHPAPCVCSRSFPNGFPTFHHNTMRTYSFGACARQWLSLLAFLVAWSASAQTGTGGRITGRVSNAATHSFLEGAVVQI